MKKIYFAILLTAIGLLSCSKEDWFENIQPEINFFAVSDDAVGPEADLRRNFFEKTGIYLLFNDTLGVREKPVISGEVVSDWQIIDLLWNMNTGSSYPDSLEFTYYSDLEQKQAAAHFVQNEILVDLPELFYPYSVLLLDNCLRFVNSRGTYKEGEDIQILPALQSTMLALGDVKNLSSYETESLKAMITGEIVISRIDVIPDEEFEEFYSYSSDYYDIIWIDIPDPYESVGFVNTDTESMMVTHEDDKHDFCEKIFELSESEFREVYADYPLVIAKMEEMVRILNEYGVKIYQ